MSRILGAVYFLTFGANCGYKKYAEAGYPKANPQRKLKKSQNND